jgi:phenylacetate-CoA ligase
LLADLFAHVALWCMRPLRALLYGDRRAYMILSLPATQPIIERVGRMRARTAFIKARSRCPAYAKFLQAQGWHDGRPWSLARVPITTKENYVKPYSLVERCYGGAIPAAGVVIDESSGSSGMPNNWVRSPEERKDVKRILQLNYQLIYRDAGCILLNCFALGPWATGMNVSMSLVDVGILKSIGPDAKKLENTLQLFGPGYRYLVFGYPPFIKSFVDGTTLDLSGYRMDLIVGGEGISEPLRTHLLKTFRTVISSYGASDLEINIGVETPMTIALRRHCIEDRALARELFGREGTPMIFQYNPLDYVIETTPDGELLFTVVRGASAAPKIRYNLKDLGGSMTWRDLAARLRTRALDLASFASPQSRFPILYVYGRGDLTVPFFGAKIYPADLEEIIAAEPALTRAIHSFQIASEESERLERRLRIHLECCEADIALPPAAELHRLLYEGLKRQNQDFREVTRMFDPSAVVVELHRFGTGPFAGRDIRIKNQYIADR